MIRYSAVSVLGIVLLGLTGLISGANQEDQPLRPDQKADAEDQETFEVTIVGASLIDAGGGEFVSFSCQGENKMEESIHFIGYTADSFGPPLENGILAPIYEIQVRRDGEWHAHPLGWCGTGMGAITLEAGESGEFGFALPRAVEWDAVRVGIRWSPPLDVPFEQIDYSTDDPFEVVWSEPFLREELDVESSRE